MKCKCGSEANNQVLTPEGPHYGKLVCAVCGAWLCWMSRPFKAIDLTKVPKAEASAPLPALTGASERQIAFGERCRSDMLMKLEDDLSPELFSAMRTITSCTFWIANVNKPVRQIRWPQEWT